MTRTSTRRRLLYGIGATSLVGFAGVGAADEHDDGNEHGDNEGDRKGADDELDLNHANIHFLRMMIPHHEQAIEMSELVPFRTDRGELLEMAEEIIEAQEEEILRMSEWLVGAGENPYAHVGMDHEEMMAEMEGMHSPEEMERLRSLDGEAFDIEFAGLMIDHHTGAIHMSEEVIENGRSPEVEAFAEEVIEAQETEIEQLREWCREWRS